jgi:hypothetical protein
LRDQTVAPVVAEKAATYPPGPRPPTNTRVPSGATAIVVATYLVAALQPPTAPLVGSTRALTMRLPPPNAAERTSHIQRGALQGERVDIRSAAVGHTVDIGLEGMSAAVVADTAARRSRGLPPKLVKLPLSHTVDPSVASALTLALTLGFQPLGRTEPASTAAGQPTDPATARTRPLVCHVGVGASAVPAQAGTTPAARTPACAPMP